jgi:hypothetical protein
MRFLATFFLLLGLLIGVIGGAGLMIGLHVSGWTWLVAIGLAKLALLASGGLMAAGAMLQRLAQRDAKRKVLESPGETLDA